MLTTQPRILSADDLLHTIQQRRSVPIKEIDPNQPVEKAHLDLMLEAANWAPSHGQTEPWRFSVFTGEGRRVLADAFVATYRTITPPEKRDPNGENVQVQRAFTAPAWISLGMRLSGAMPEWEETSAVSMAVQNLHLMACALGYVGKWGSGILSRHELIAETIGIQAPDKLLGLFYIGKPAKPVEPGKRKPIQDKVKWVTGP